MQAIVIDDSRAMRGILKRVLIGMAFEVREAADGQLGLARLAEAPAPDLILVDWNMPNMNGYEFVRAARQNPTYAETRIVMVTTEVEMSQIQLALEAGANEYVMKPFTEESLREKIESLGFAAPEAA